ncbi:MAG: crossover junction endodeoxyribonuclease RuvC [bacterium]|nr:crossover junction endodeoxyribonuclease RuvC [bacterium]
MLILGIDPGTATTGYAIIKNEHGKIKTVEYGCIRTLQKKSDAQRLEEIFLDLTKLIKKHRPELIAVESVFFYNNVKTAITVAQARGVVLLCARQNKIKIAEFTPLQVKSSLTGYGKADKKQVQYMVKALLGLKSIPKPDDAADALALAICAAK